MTAALPPFRVAHAAADHWGTAAKGCLEGLGAVGDANLGILYATQGLADDLPSILTFLRETTRIVHWLGASAPGILAGDGEYRRAKALAVMTGILPEELFRLFVGQDGGLDGGFRVTHADLGGLTTPDPTAPAFFLPGDVGAFVSSPRIAGVVAADPVSGLWLSSELPLAVGITQGCTPIGAVEPVTKAEGLVIKEIGGRSALAALKAAAGDLIARDLTRARGYIHIAAMDRPGYRVHAILGVDPLRGWLTTAGPLPVGAEVTFVRRDASAAQDDLGRMTDTVKRRLGARAPRAALYFANAARGVHMFGREGAETAAIRAGLGGVPLIGCLGGAEIFGGRVHGHSGVLVALG